MKRYSLRIVPALILLLSQFPGQLAAQRTCASYDHLQEQLKNDIRLREKIAQLETFTLQNLEHPAKGFSGLVSIPVHVIVVYANADQNISDAQIQSQLTVLNQDYRKLNADWVTTPSEFISSVTDFEIEFTLQAIERHANSTLAWGVDDDVKIAYPPYLPNTHLNLWVCRIGSDILGYAQFPGGDPATDGVVISPQYFGSSDYDDGSFFLAPPYDKGRTATHEIGHWLNLHHIWGDDEGDANECSGTDYVEDTPNQSISYGGCPTHPQVSCSSDDMFMNYMDYVDDECMVMFTEGQKQRAQTVFMPGAPRASFATSGVYSCDSTARDGSIDFSLTFDEYPHETSWSLVDNEGTLIDEGYGYSAKNTTITKSWTLDPGMYVFNIYDVFGDGICCSFGNGSYILSDGSSAVLKTGGQFGAFDQLAFCVPSSGDIHLTSPNGGELWEAGSVQPISWSSDGTSGTVAIDFSYDNGSSWNTLVTNTPDDGSYSWTLPKLSSDECLISIRDTELNLADTSDANFTIFESLAPDISVSPETSDFGDVLPGDTVKLIVDLENTGLEALEIQSTSLVGINPAAFSLLNGGGAQILAPGDTAGILIGFNPVSGGVKYAALSISSNDPDENPALVILTGNCLAPEIEVSSDAIDFGQAYIGTELDDTLTVRNTGTNELSIVSSDISGSHASAYTLVNSSGSEILGPGEQKAFILRFSPLTTGTKTAVLTLENNDPDEGSFPIILSGSGLPANEAPVISLTDQTITEGESFDTLYLDDYVSDDFTAVEDILWKFEGHSQLDVSITDRVCTIGIPHEDWFGSETIRFTALDDGSIPLSGELAITFVVQSVNDPPVISDIPNQTIINGELFQAVQLKTFISDIETPDSLIDWSYSGNTDLVVQIEDQVASVLLPSENWIGDEAIVFSARDVDADSPISVSDTAVFRVLCVNSPPGIQDIPDQFITQGEAFGPILLSAYVSDLETPADDISWTVSGNTIIEVTISEGIASFEITDESWYGTETLMFEASDDGPCPYMASDHSRMTVLKAEGLEDLSTQEIQLYPNPTTGELNLVLPAKLEGKITLKVINAPGEIVQSLQVISESGRVNTTLHELKPGIYHLIVSTDEKAFVLPLMIK
ncbi:MAG: choice-of-anchor D domain-containing protein [Bacteroidales bacterium]|nr:choice-of-anchor D domain-containing protein [Bacteroidales bacterium]